MTEKGKDCSSNKKDTLPTWALPPAQHEIVGAKSTVFVNDNEFLGRTGVTAKANSEVVGAAQTAIYDNFCSVDFLLHGGMEMP